MLNTTKSTEGFGIETSLTRHKPKDEKQHSAPVANREVWEEQMAYLVRW